MAGQVSPGIVLRERDLTTQTIVNTQANTAAFVGSFEKGPVGTITSIATEKELLEVFGKPNNNNYEDWFTAATFLSYGGQLQVVRADDLTAPVSKNAVNTGTAVNIRNNDEFVSKYATYTWNFAAKTSGTWGNSLYVSWVDGIEAVSGDYNNNELLYTGAVKWNTIAGKPATSPSAAAVGGSLDEMHIAIIDGDGKVSGTPGTILETFLYVSKSIGAKDSQGASNYYVDVINQKSRFVYAGAPLTNTGSALLTDYTVTVDSSDLVSASDLDLSGGIDAYVTTVATINNAFDLFGDVEEIDIDFILCGGSLATEADQVTKAQKVITIASGRKDCIAFVSPHNGFLSISSSSLQREDIITFFDSVGSSSSYAVFDSGYKYIYDRFNDTYRYIPCCGDIAGLCVQTSDTSEDWFSPAGVSRGNLKSAVKLAYTPTKTDRDKLYLKRVNPIASFPGQGIVLFGDKTALATPSAFDRINVRRLFLAMEKRIGQLARTVLFELNDTTTRSSFSSAANSYLSEVKSKRGVTDYLVVCDDTNNTADVIDRNEFVAEIFVKPSRSINYITITFVATRSGVSFSEVTGR